jgi:hypothetical protein
MLATLTRPRARHTPARSVRAMLLEITYRLHASQVVERPRAKDGRRKRDRLRVQG